MLYRIIQTLIFVFS